MFEWIKSLFGKSSSNKAPYHYQPLPEVNTKTAMPRVKPPKCPHTRCEYINGSDVCNECSRNEWGDD
jgi:hypothetical protein